MSAARSLLLALHRGQRGGAPVAQCQHHTGAAQQGMTDESAPPVWPNQGCAVPPGAQGWARSCSRQGQDV